MLLLKATAPARDALVSGLLRSRCRHIPVAGFLLRTGCALLIGISAVPVSCCAHLSAPDVWQLSFLGAAASPGSLATSPRPLPIEGLPSVKECLTVDPQGNDF